MNSLTSEPHDVASLRGEAVSSSELERECRMYARYLIGQEPSAYVIEKYLDFHQKFEPSVKPDGFDRFLLGISARGPRWTRLADSYASRFQKQSRVRTKLVLTVALLECASPSFQILDRVPAGGFAGNALHLAGSALAYGCVVVFSLILFTPVRIWMRLRKQ